MPKYQKKPGDLRFRIVALTVNIEPEFQHFKTDVISYGDDKVLEILREDGKTVLEYGEKSPTHIVVTPYKYGFSIQSDIPTARLWVREIGCTNGTYYKVPMELSVENGRKWFLLPAGLQEYELCGDKYFEKVYSF